MNNRTDWPFEVRLVPLDELFSDSRYQRPPQESFVERMVNSFDDALVGVLDVSQRQAGSNGKPHLYAIMDGLQRYTAMGKVGKHGCYACIYTGLSLEEEAMFFYRKNKDRRRVHPFYNFRARMVAGDEEYIRINALVEAQGYKLDITSTPENSLPAIRSIVEAYGFSSPNRKESLSPSLKMMRQAWHGLKGGKDGELIRGLGRFFQPFSDSEIDWDWLLEKLISENPRLIVTRAREIWFTKSYSANPVAEEIIKLYNTGRRKGKLNRNFLTKTR